jgi:hypothetical protein
MFYLCLRFVLQKLLPDFGFGFCLRDLFVVFCHEICFAKTATKFVFAKLLCKFSYFACRVGLPCPCLPCLPCLPCPCPLPAP